MPKLLILLFVASGIPGLLAAQESVVLRDMSILKNQSVARFTEDFVELSDGRKLTWDQVYSAKLSDEKFQKWHSSLSLPLYRMKHRVAAGDFSGALKPANQLRKIFNKKRDTESFAVVSATRILGQIQASRREQAVLTLSELLDSPYATIEPEKSRFAKTFQRLRLQCDVKSGYCRQLTPIFFDQAAARSTLSQFPKPSETQREYYYVYLAALSDCAGDARRKNELTKKLEDEYPNSKWISLFRNEIKSQAQLDAVEHQSLRRSLPSLWAIRQYRVGLIQLADENLPVQQSGAVNLLKVPALLGTEFPELSAACLHQVATWYEKQKSSRQSLALKKEIATYFPATQFGRSPTNKK